MEVSSSDEELIHQSTSEFSLQEQKEFWPGPSGEQTKKKILPSEGPGRMAQNASCWYSRLRA